MLRFNKKTFAALAGAFALAWLALKYLLPSASFAEYFGQLKAAVEKLESQLPQFAFHRALYEMGLQGSWKKLDLMAK